MILGAAGVILLACGFLLGAVAAMLLLSPKVEGFRVRLLGGLACGMFAASCGAAMLFRAVGGG